MASSDSIREDPTENSGACHKVLSLARRSLIASGSLDSAVALSLEAAFGEETLTGALQILVSHVNPDVDAAKTRDG